MRNVASEQMDDDELPLSSLRRKKMKKKRGSSPMRRTPSPMRRLPRRAVMRVYGLDGKLLEDDVTNIHNFLAAHTKDLPAKVGFVILGAYPILIEKQTQLDALPKGSYNAQVLYAHPTQAQLEAFQRRRQTSGVSKASRLK